MICYRDMTFCGYWRDCANAATCHRPLTPEVETQARNWWGKDGAPISMYAEKPKCHKAKENPT